MYLEMKEQTVEDIEYITGENFNKKGNLIKLSELKDAIEDLLIEYDKLKEKLEDEKEQREKYFQPKSEYEIIGMREEEF